MTSSPAKKYRLRDGVLAQTQMEQAILLDSENGAYFELNGSATDMLRELLAGAEFAQICATISSQYAVDAARVNTDLIALIDELLERKLLIAE